MTKPTDSDSFLPSSATPRTVINRRQLCLYISVVTSVIVNVVVVTLFLILVAFKPSHSINNVPDGEKGAVCFDCSYLGSGIKSSDTLYNVYRTKNRTICCLKGDDNLNRLFKKIISDEQKKISNKDFTPADFASDVDVFLRLWRNKTGAHLCLDSRALNDGYLSWVDQDSYNSAYTSGVEYKNHALRITTPGLYLVYSNIKYTRKYPQTQGGSIFVHSISRYHPRQPNLGLKNILVSKNSYPKHTARRSSFLSAILNLRAGDQLRVNVSDTDSIHDQFMSSYFGVMKI